MSNLPNRFPILSYTFNPVHVQTLRSQNKINLLLLLDLYLSSSPFLTLAYTYITLHQPPSTTPRDQPSWPTSQAISLLFCCVIPVFLLPYGQRYLSFLILRTLANFRRNSSLLALKWQYMSCINRHRPFSWCFNSLPLTLS